LLLGASAATVIPKTSAPTAVAQTVQLNDEQLDGVSGGAWIVSSCFGYVSYVLCYTAPGGGYGNPTGRILTY
jgi:hypothetical protein